MPHLPGCSLDVHCSLYICILILLVEFGVSGKSPAKLLCGEVVIFIEEVIDDKWKRR